MPNLSLEECQRFWFEYADPSIYRVLTFMEGVENWTVDGDSNLEAALTKLGDILEDIGGVDLKQEADFMKVAAYIKATRNLRLLQCLDTAYPGAASKLLAFAESEAANHNEVANLFLKRNIIFERLRLITRVFSPERLKLIYSALEETQ